MENVTNIKGRDIAAPMQHVTMNGQRYAMVFNNRAARIAEDVYEDQYGRDTGYYGILAEVAIPKHRAILAIVYGGITAAGADMSWEEFEETFKLTDVEGMAQAIHKGVLNSLPDEDPEEEGKNAETTPTAD